jgi:predicted Rossmann fold flavoprotein
MKSSDTHEQSNKYDVIVVGGGASGMMTAGTAAKNGKRVLLIEKNKELGKKLKITGGGRCNITNETFDTKKLLKKYGDAEKFLYSPFSQFGVQDTFSFFEGLGLELVTEARDRVFPKSQKAMDVFQTLHNFMAKYNVTVQKDTTIKKFHVSSDESVNGEKAIKSVETKDGEKYFADNFVIATGGNSYPETGSTGDGFTWLKQLGHTIHQSSPNIVPLKTAESWVHELSGTSLSFMKITFYLDGKKSFSKTGKVLFTHFGLSGPLILNSAKEVSDILPHGEVTATIDCYPDTDHKQLEKNILKVFDANKNKSFKNIVKDIVPPGLSNTIIGFHIIPSVMDKVHSISKEDRKTIVHLLKALPVTITGLMGMDRAVVSDGGIPLTEIDTKRMKSSLYSNLYLTGDILHINRPSGGYSLQLCWTTGHVAGQLQ